MRQLLKHFSNIIIVSIVTFTICEGQDTIKMKVPLLKESPQIDSLISSFTRDRSFQASTNDSCILLGLLRNENDAGFISGIHALGKAKAIFGYANFYNHEGLGYFEFKGYLIFVYGDPSVDEFFRRAKSNREFNFIASPVDDDLLVESNYFQQVVFYENEKFSYGAH